MAGDAFGFEDHQTFVRCFVGIEFEELTARDEAFTTLADGVAIGIGLQQERLIKGIGYLTLGDHFFAGRDAATSGVNVDNMIARCAATDTDFGAGFGREIGLLDVAFDAVIGKFANEFDNVLTLFNNGLWQTKDGVDLVEYTVELLLEVLAVVDNAMMRVS